MVAGGGTQMSYEQLWKVVRDLRAVALEIEIPALAIMTKVVGGIIDETMVAKSADGRPITSYNPSMAASAACGASKYPDHGSR